MRIEEDRKLDYDSVLIRPKRSTLGSRSEVELRREFQFRNADRGSERTHYHGVPIMASNMDGVGTFEMAAAIAKQGLFTCLVKNYSAAELLDYFSGDTPQRAENTAYSMGITDVDYEKFQGVYKASDTHLNYVCVDVANGYSERFSQFIKKLRDACPDIIIIAGMW